MKKSRKSRLAKLFFSLILLILLSVSTSVNLSLVTSSELNAKKVSGQALDKQARKECRNNSNGKKDIERCVSAYKQMYKGGQSTAYTCATPVVTPGNPATGSLGGVTMGGADPSCQAGINLGIKAAERDGGSNETNARKVCQSNENPGASDKQVAACRKGFVGAENSKTIQQTCQGYSNDEEKEACEAGFRAKKNNSNTPALKAYTAYDDSDEEDDIGCQGGFFGFMLCPLIETLADVTNATAGLVDSLMQYKLIATTGADRKLDDEGGNIKRVSPSSMLQSSWRNFLNIANVLLVIAFLAIIFSQATSVGISNYGIKKMLPRLIIGAILINVSFYICAFLVDITNILGNSMLGLFQKMANIEGDPTIKGSMNQLGGIDAIAGGLVGNLLVGVAAVAVAAFFFIPILLGLFLVFIILTARQVVITVLVLVSPIAFVAWLLPNTEQYFKKWWSMFTKMLLAYPIVMAVFGASLFVATLVQAVNAVDGGSVGGILDKILPLVVLSIPLFALPKIIMSSDAIMGKVGGVVRQGYKATGLTALGQKQRQAVWGQTGAKAADNIGYRARSTKLGKRWTDRALRDKKLRKERRSGLEMGAEKRYEDFIHSANAADGPNKGARKHLERITGGDKKEIRGYMDRAAAAVNKREEEAVKEAMAGIQNNPEYRESPGGKNKARYLGEALNNAMASGDVAAATAATNMLMQQGSPGIDEIKNITRSGGSGKSHQAFAAALGEHYETLESKAPETLEYVNSNGTSGTENADSSAWKKVTGENIGKLTDSSFRTGLAKGAFSNERLLEITSDSRVWGGLTEERRNDIIRHLDSVTRP